MSISVLDALQPAKKPALIVLVLVFGLFVGAWVHGKYFSDRSPIQPIDFSHRIHVTDNEIPCQHCHIYAERTPVAGVPSVSKCMGCHNAVSSVRESPEILKLATYWKIVNRYRGLKFTIFLTMFTLRISGTSRQVSRARNVMVP